MLAKRRFICVPPQFANHFADPGRIQFLNLHFERLTLQLVFEHCHQTQAGDSRQYLIDSQIVQRSGGKMIVHFHYL